MSTLTQKEKLTQMGQIYNFDHDPNDCTDCASVKYCGCIPQCDGCRKHIANCNTSLCKECEKGR